MNRVLSILAVGWAMLCLPALCMGGLISHPCDDHAVPGHDDSPGHPDEPEAPHDPYRFDRILVTAGAPEVPRPLVEQLVEGGRLVIPVGGHDHQDLLAIDRKQGRTIETSILPCRFVKLIGQAGW